MATVCLALVCLAALPAVAQGYHVIGKIEIGGEGGWDYLYVDAAARRLYVSHATRVVVVDIDSQKVVGEIPDTPGVHGIAVAATLGKGYTSNGRDGTVTVFDPKTLKASGTIKVGENPDCILYEASTKRVFAFNRRGHSASVIDAVAGTVVATIELEGNPEFAATDDKGSIWVNLDNKSEIVALDAAKATIKARWSIKEKCEGGTGLAFDRKNRRLFAVCGGSKTMGIVDADSGKVAASVPIGSGPDAAGFDPGTGLAFSSNGEGNLTVVQRDGPDQYSVAETVPTQRGARTMALDAKTHKVFLSAAEFEPAPAPTADQPRPRPKMVPNSFLILVVGR